MSGRSEGTTPKVLVPARGDAAALLTELAGQGIELWVEGGKLRYRAPVGVLTDEQRAALRRHRDALVAEIANRSTAARRGAVRGADRYEPFPVSDVQGAYLVGRSPAFELGGVGCHGYLELALDDIDVVALEAAWRRLIERHDMLRVVFGTDGSQRVLPSVPDFVVASTDLAAGDDWDAAVAAVRAELSHRVYDPSRWPLFDLRVTRQGRVGLLHCSFDLLAADFTSFEILLDELGQLTADPEADVAPIEVTYRDYMVDHAGRRDDPSCVADRQWWADRLEAIPPGPELPLATEPTREAGAATPPTFRRWRMAVAAPEWAGLRERAAVHRVTPTVAVLAAYVEVLAAWSRSSRFTVALTLLDRQPIHEHIDRLVGDFTSISLLAVDHDGASSWAERADRIQRQLWDDLDHRSWSGVEVARALARHRAGPGARFPVVFTSTIGLRAPQRAGSGWSLADAAYGITQTPQVWLDCQVFEAGDELVVNWDVRDETIMAEVVDAAFEAFGRLLRRLAQEPTWAASAPLELPAHQAARRAAANATGRRVEETTLTAGFVGQAARRPERTAVVDAGGELAYGELLDQARAVAATVQAAGCQMGDLVAVVVGKGRAQVAAVLGILLAGAAYLPIDTTQPPLRRATILTDAGVRVVLTDAARRGEPWPDGTTVLAVEAATAAGGAPVEAAAAPGDLAYVIYTSGSTGRPKGVMVNHRMAWNTIADINRRYQVTGTDRVLALAGLGFDLSVYDIFGILAVGGALVFPDPDRARDPSHWAALTVRHGVTVWNSVPAHAQMLADHLDAGGSAAVPPVRLVLMSGDWIPVDLPPRLAVCLPGALLVSLGGATEASIWSIQHTIVDADASGRSVPYGLPLANQTFHVLDRWLRARPDWVVGELHIGGAGVALGYLGDTEKTAARFVTHPVTGERLYRTGDLGRYRSDGEIELLGRDDQQVKIRGHRVELAEIDAVLAAVPGVASAAAVVVGEPPLGRRIVAFVRWAEGSGPPDGGDLAGHLATLLPDYMIPTRVVTVSHLPLTANGKVDRAALAEAVPPVAPACADRDLNGGEALRGEVEETVGAAWAAVLGVEGCGRHDNFFSLGGDSLKAARLVAALDGRPDLTGGRSFDELLVLVLGEPTVARLAARLAGPSAVANAERSPTSTVWHGDPTSGAATVTVLVHDGGGDAGWWTGTFGPAPAVPAVMLAVDRDWLAAAPTGTLVDDLADRHAAALRPLAAPLRVIGCGSGCLLAMEVARRLRESGSDVQQLVVVPEGSGPAGPGPDPLVAAGARCAPFPYGGDIVVVGVEGSSLPWDELCLGTLRRVPASGLAAALGAATGSP